MGVGYSTLEAGLNIDGVINIPKYEVPIDPEDYLIDRDRLMSVLSIGSFKKIYFVSSDPTETIANSYDVSVSQNGNVMAYITGNQWNPDGLYVGGDYIYAPSDCSELFKDMWGPREVYLGILDTSLVTDMFSMFNGLSNLQSLDLGEKFDTSNVTNMFAMFQESRELASINFGTQFDTSHVNDMSFMFSNIGAGLSNPEYDISTFSFDSVDVGNFRDFINPAIVHPTFYVKDSSAKTFLLQNVYGMENEQVIIKDDCTIQGPISDSFSAFSAIDCTKIKNIVFANSAHKFDDGLYYDSAGSSYDISVSQNGSITAQLYEVGDGYYDLYVISDFNKILANGDSRHLFSGFTNLDAIYHLDYVDMLYVRRASSMFNETGYNNSSFEISLPKFPYNSFIDYDNIFDGWQATQTIYVEDSDTQDWIINNSNNSNLINANVLIQS